MNWGQTLSALVWLGIATAIATGAYDLGIGALNNPGPGLFAFVIAICMVALSLSVAITSLREPATSPPSARKMVAAAGNARPVIAVVGALVFYALALERIGFVLCTVIFLSALLAVLGRRSIAASLAWGAAITAGSYLIFAKLLKITLPVGPLGF